MNFYLSSLPKHLNNAFKEVVLPDRAGPKYTILIWMVLSNLSIIIILIYLLFLESLKINIKNHIFFFNLSLKFTKKII